jgi:Putative prokaryotic signal transducing protein
MPLVYMGRADGPPITEAQERARKVKPQYVGGGQVKVAFAQNLSEAELIQGILLEEGIPSVQRRSRGFDVPDFLAAGPRDILVPQAAEASARTLLADARVGGEAPADDGSAAPRPLRLLAGVLVALAAAAALVWVLYQLAA